ncbi:hypothetical protein P4S68_04305 [Pseudoalteromonas sp. Hal099]
MYNHKELAAELEVDFEFQTQSDCEVILALYKQKGPEFLDDLNGIFAFCLYDEENDAYLIGRDHIGIIPLYTGHDEHGNFMLPLSLKRFHQFVSTLKSFHQGTTYTAKMVN